jgi:signal transduction histidine kinase
MSTESVRQRDDLLVAASHELRTPLTALLLHTQSIERALSDGASVDRSALAARAQKAVRQIQRLARLVDELLEASRLSAGRIWLTREQVMLSEVVDEVVERLADRAAESGTEVSVRTSGSAMGRWDRLRVEQVVENLLSNALQFAPGLPVEIRTAVADHGMATLAVRDRGPGIAPEDQERIFKRFERTTGSSGMGLGLYVTRELVRAHGGTVEVSSTPGAGAEFTVRLPSEPESATQPWSEAARDGSISRPDPRSRGS